MPRSIKRLAVGAVSALVALSAAAAVQAQSRPLNVEIDHATRVQLRAPAGSVIVANPRIADVTVVDANTLFITGKGYGVTEVVAVDAAGRPLPRPFHSAAHRWLFAQPSGRDLTTLWNDAIGLGACGDWLYHGFAEYAWLSGHVLGAAIAAGANR